MNTDIICFCHLRWNFVYQRPQHLLSRFANKQRVFIIEEPIFDAVDTFNKVYHQSGTNLWIITPHLSNQIAPEQINSVQRKLLDLFIASMDIKKFILWYYSPMALLVRNHLSPEIIIYDCMDELSAFKFASPALKQNEFLLLKK